jgi:predicted SnoaL-like aldol condensation-catalyzing enzyme
MLAERIAQCRSVSSLKYESEVAESNGEATLDGSVILRPVAEEKREKVYERLRKGEDKMNRKVMALTICLAVLLIVGKALAQQLAPTGHAADAKQMEENKKIVVAFYDEALNQKDFDAASKFLGPRYTQHNPAVVDGPEGLKAFIAFLKDKFPNNHSEIKRIFADGDYVILHVHAVREPGTRGNAIVDIFKLENGKIVEHWDVNQPVPEKAANDNGML